jgi:CelD/BcsL family acetyltransferase involved in cellulose biosynthesis
MPPRSIIPGSRRINRQLGEPYPLRVLVWDHWSSDLEARWAALLASIPGHTIYQTWDWNRAWWDAFGRDRRLCLVGVEDERGSLIGLAPWMVTDDRSGCLRRIEFVGTPNWASDYADVLVAPGDGRALGALVDWLLLTAGPFTEINLDHLREDSPHVEAITDLLRHAGSEWSLGEMTRAPTRLLVDAAADRALLDKQSLRRHHHAMSRSGRLEFWVAKTVDEVLAELPTFFDQHVRRREAAGTRSQFVDPAQRGFYADLTQRLLPRGWLHFSAVRLDGLPIAYHFGLQYENAYLWYKPTFEPRLARRSPGEVLLRFLIQDVIDRGFGELDFTVGSEQFKYRFANQTRRILRLRVPPRQA